MGRRLLRVPHAYLALTVACTAAVGWFLARGALHLEIERSESDLLAVARAFAAETGDVMASAPERHAPLERLADAMSIDVTLVPPPGRSIAGTTDLSAAAVSAPEVLEALGGAVGRSRGPGGPDGRESLRVAVPVRGGGAVLAAISLEDVRRRLARTNLQIAAAAAAMALVTVGLAMLATSRLRRPLGEMRTGARRFAAGDFSARLRVPEVEELAGLAESLNGMAAQLDERMGTIERQATELDIVLSSMSEGILAVDTDERVISMNAAAAEMLHADRARSPGRRLQEVFRSPELERMIARVLEAGEGVEGEVVLHADRPRVVEVHGTVLRDPRSGPAGAVVVLADLTEVRRLENVRRDFVANVSHELKTPITSIKGFVETLRDGALRDPERSERFLAIIGRQAERLTAIIDDLLTLSRLEQQGPDRGIPLKESAVRPLLESAAQICEMRAAASARESIVRVTCEEGLSFVVNPPLLEQALVNLIDNAIKHGGAGSPIEVSARRVESGVEICVADRGCGIAAEHLPRIFERFYRVDRARSRQAGGTGLGLAIVKHIAQAHQGSVHVESAPGEGSTFRIRLPGTRSP